ncbi:hypothetical protein CC86DRAFT_413811 [Ophiobolus disseminans]|uniref:Uncharacterized protein n=1 Tax=Ophiobolus disseminans TaxID=1469910 RepID=A0A6A6ZEF8_9PLEO|nr:hypothetical protein CC86DRAFT_413811 [Ophiobolus disseminans]
MELGTNSEELKRYYVTPLSEDLRAKFPYLREGNLPRPIPTAQEVEAAAALGSLNTFKIRLATNVYRVPDVYAVKVSALSEILIEALNMMYLEKMGIRTPKLYAVFSHRGCNPHGYPLKTGQVLPKYHYLVMERIDGELLEHHYAGYSPQLKEAPEYYGMIHERGFPGSSSLFQIKEYAPRGPWHSYDDLVDAMVESARFSCTNILNGSRLTQHSSVTVAYRSLEYMLRNTDAQARRPTLAHLDLHSLNIIAKRGSSDEDCEVVILDWYSLGWVPAWVQIAHFMNCSGYKDGACSPTQQEVMYTYNVLDRLKGVNNIALAEWWAENWGHQ